MKNIHILRTDKPSRLYKNEISELGFLSEKLTNTDSFCVSYNIYITSDEEIKEGDWIFDIVTKKIEIAKFNHNDLKRDWKKIILTTDQDLIKDGVQPIEDEFLEWFVKNPSCEEVKVYKDKRLEIEQDFDFYEIIIPKEEPKQSTKDRIMSDTSEESKQKARDYANSLVEKQETVFENAKLILRKHILKNKEQVIKDLDEMRKLSNEQEILEQVAERLYPDCNNVLRQMAKETFINGAKWQQEQIGKSEFLQRLRGTLSDAEARRLIFETFKNK